MSTTRFIAGVILIFLGLSVLFKIDIWNILWPAILILLGIKILSRPDRSFDFKSASTMKQDELDETVIFSSVSRKIDTEDFKGGKFVSIFGEGKLDLSKAKSESKVINMEIVSIFGSAKVAVPKNWKVSSEGVGVFGGYENNTTDSEKEKTVTLKIRGSAIFGGVEIFN